MMADDRFGPNESRRRFLLASGSLGALALAGCTENPDTGDDGGSGGNSDGGHGDGNLSGTVDVAGSSTVFPLATAVKTAFNEKHPDVNVNLSSTGTGAGFNNHFCKGRSDFNNASRPIAEKEKQLCSQNDIGWVELRVATDALTAIVHPEADWVDCVTVEELKQIWKPNGAQKWSDVRSEWPDREFKLFGPTSASGTFDYFTEAVVGTEGKHRKDYSATEQDRQIIRGVEGSKYAMGYLGFAYYSENKDRVKALAIDDGDGKCVKPSLETAKSGKYRPLSRPLFTYAAKGELAKDHVAEFGRFFVKQSTNRELVAKQVGYVPNTEETMEKELDKLEGAIEEARG